MKSWKTRLGLVVALCGAMLAAGCNLGSLTGEDDSDSDSDDAGDPGGGG